MAWGLFNWNLTWHGSESLSIFRANWTAERGLTLISGVLPLFITPCHQQPPTTYASVSVHHKGEGVLQTTSLGVPSHSFSCPSSAAAPNKVPFPFVMTAETALRLAWINIKNCTFTTWLTGVADDSYYIQQVKRRNPKKESGRSCEGRWRITAKHMCLFLFY